MICNETRVELAIEQSSKEARCTAMNGYETAARVLILRCLAFERKAVGTLRSIFYWFSTLHQFQ